MKTLKIFSMIVFLVLTCFATTACANIWHESYHLALTVRNNWNSSISLVEVYAPDNNKTETSYANVAPGGSSYFGFTFYALKPYFDIYLYAPGLPGGRASIENVSSIFNTVTITLTSSGTITKP